MPQFKNEGADVGAAELYHPEKEGDLNIIEHDSSQYGEEEW